MFPLNPQQQKLTYFTEQIPASSYSQKLFLEYSFKVMESQM